MATNEAWAAANWSFAACRSWRTVAVGGSDDGGADPGTVVVVVVVPPDGGGVVTGVPDVLHGLVRFCEACNRVGVPLMSAVVASVMSHPSTAC